MRIAFSGTGNSGKTTMIKSFLHTWSNYTTPDKTYREVLQKNNLLHSSKTTTDTQSKILDFMIDQVQSYDKDAKVVFDRCSLDNIAYSLWANEKDIKGFTKQFLSKQIDLMKESMRSLDIIFMCRFDAKQLIEDDGFRDTDKEFIQEVDNIFYSLYNQYRQNPEADIFFPKGDSPAIIELPHTAQERIDLISEYVNIDGELYGDETSIFSDVDKLEQLVYEQEQAHKAEEKDKELYKRFGL
jgi:GTPase SAR1 family protein